MAILGLGKEKSPFIYLDNFITQPDWDKLHADVSYGIGKSQWDKRFVSSGVHKNWTDKEITPILKDIEWNGLHLSEYERSLYNTLKTYDEKIKFVSALLHTSHPFWVLFIRNNLRKEISGVVNKSNGAECEWTENSKYFPSLVEFIKTMPFKEIGRVIIFMTEPNNQTVPHFDSRAQCDRPNDDFIWFNTKTASKNIFVMDDSTFEKSYPEIGKRFIWFNEMDFHGTDPVSHFSFSIRVDGKFKDEIKDSILQNRDN